MGAKKEITVNIEKDPLDKIGRGIEKAADTICITFGPRGRNVMLDKGRYILAQRDGVTVSRDIKLKDKLENMGAMIVREASSHTNTIAGDGTTTAAALVKAMFFEGKKLIAAGHNPMHVQRSLEKAVDKIAEQLKKLARKVETREEITSVATISANNDPFLGELIAKAIYEVGEKGTVLVENSTNSKTEVKFQAGVVIDRGMSDTSMHFADMGSRNASFDDGKVIVIDQAVSQFETLIPALTYCQEHNHPLLLVMREIEPTVLNLLIKNKIQQGLKIAVICTPGLGNYELVEDFASVVGATPYHRDYNPLERDTFNPGHLGSAKRIIVGKHFSTIIEGDGNVQDRVKTLKNAKNTEEEDMEKRKLQDRINKLTNSIATLSVAAETETEMSDKKLRIEDSINASRAAVSEGIVPGGGLALFRCVKYIGDSLGDQILGKALESPLRCIIGNTGENVEKIISQIEDKEFSVGFDGNALEIADMYEVGILDPVKVTRTALQKAASSAGMALATGACIIRNEDV
jgi:chaperonin GroEL